MAFAQCKAFCTLTQSKPIAPLYPELFQIQDRLTKPFHIHHWNYSSQYLAPRGIDRNNLQFLVKPVDSISKHI
jgi:hypothetical protein